MKSVIMGQPVAVLRNVMRTSVVLVKVMQSNVVQIKKTGRQCRDCRPDVEERIRRSDQACQRALSQFRAREVVARTPRSSALSSRREVVMMLLSLMASRSVSSGAAFS